MPRPKGRPLPQSHRDAIRDAHLERSRIIAAVRNGNAEYDEDEDQDDE